MVWDFGKKSAWGNINFRNAPSGSWGKVIVFVIERMNGLEGVGSKINF